MDRLIAYIIANQELHLRWLNTLSYLENCGARKIAACEHPTQVSEMMLKHAAEEFRHSYILKKQMTRLGESLPTYERQFLLGGWQTVHYLNKLDLHINRYLKHQKIERDLTYMLVTYAIEKRAEQLYPLYETHLRKGNSPISVKSILLEEEAHLREIEEELSLYQVGNALNNVCALEQKIYREWTESILSNIVKLDEQNYPNLSFATYLYSTSKECTSPRGSGVCNCSDNFSSSKSLASLDPQSRVQA